MKPLFLAVLLALPSSCSVSLRNDKSEVTVGLRDNAWNVLVSAEGKKIVPLHP